MISEFIRNVPYFLITQISRAESSGGSESQDSSWLQNWLNNSVGGRIYDTVDSVSSAVSNVFEHLGHYCVEWINGGLKVFQQLTWSAKDLLTFNTADDTFADFNVIINNISGVLTIIASSLLVLFFLAGLASDAWDSRHDMDVWGLIKDIVKLIVSVVVVNNALLLTRLVFNAGAGLAELVAYMGVGGSNSDISSSMGITGTAARYLAYGTNGIRGVFMLVVYVLGSVVVVVCGVMITIEIYQRIFKIYILIPFSTLSFSTFVMGNRSGGEVFSGYLKSICQVSLEAMVIMLAISFTYRLCNNHGVMQDIFPSDFEDYAVVSATTYDDYVVLREFTRNYNITYEESTGSNGFRNYMDDFYANSERLSDESDADENSDNMWERYTAFNNRLLGAGFDINNVNSNLISSLDSLSSKPAVVLYSTERNAVQQPIDATSFFNNQVAYGEPGQTFRTYYFFMYPEVSTKDALMLLIQVVFPCMLCVGAVKAAGTYSGMAVGKG